jgi:beta-mannanase
MNGNWYPWSVGSTPDEYILAWRRVHDIFSNKSLDSSTLQWIWSVNYQDSGNYKAEEYWVGDNYVDWLGVDGYNWGASSTWSHWKWPNEVFDDMIGRLRNLSSTKPLSINEYGSTSIVTTNVSNIQMKTEWLNQFCDYIDTKQVKIVSYFNLDLETDWAIFGGIHGDVVWNNFNTYTAYKNCLLTDGWILANSTNPRIINDEQFYGRF